MNIIIPIYQMFYLNSKKLNPNFWKFVFDSQKQERVFEPSKKLGEVTKNK
jgi:hypothetical protein